MTDCRIPANGAAIFLPTPEDFKKMENEKREPIHTEPLNFTKFVVPLKKISSDVYLHKLNEITISRKLIGT